MLIRKQESIQKNQSTIRKNNYIAYCLLMIISILCVGFTVHATNDDPGKERLSGEAIPTEFYSSESTDIHMLSHSFTQYGAEKTKSPYTKKTYVHRSDLVDRPITHGIDVSYWQGEIDWEKVKADGIKYAFIRVGYRGSSEGKLSEDKYFKQNIEGALNAGIEVGVYMFSQAITKKEAKEEANFILNRIKDYNITFPVVFDYEFTGNPGRLRAAKLSKAAGTSICLQFCKTVQAAGYTPMLYANPDMLNNYLNPDKISDKYPIWLANYTTQTTYTGKYDYWQYSSDGSVDGINGRVDMNFFYGTDIANATIAPIENRIYTGKTIKPTLTVTYKDKTLVKDVDYTVHYSNHKKVGVAKVTIKGKGIYYGTLSTTFNIKPRQMTAVKAKKKSNNYITLSWKKDNSITGYQIYRSTAIDGKYKKLATITKSTTTSYKNTKLANGQCYYYKIRSYKTVNGKKWYSAFSDAKAIYTKTGYTRNAYARKSAPIYTTAEVSETPLVTASKMDTMSVSYSTKDKAGNTWYRVIYKKDGATHKGFVQATRVTITKLGKVRGNDVNVRKSYSTSSKKITTLNRNAKVTILKTKKRKGTTWYQIQFKKKKKTYTGWISADFVKLI